MDNGTTTIEKERMERLNQSRLRNRSKATNLLMSGSRLAVSAATGGVGRSASREIQRRVSGSVSAAGEKAAEFYKKKMDGMNEPEKKLSGVMFWTIFSLSVIKELSDIFLNFTIILSIFTLITGLIITFIIGFYLFSQGVSPGTKKIVLWIVSMMIEAIPFLNLIPTYPISLLIMKVMENNEFLKKHAQVAHARGVSSLF